jgi:hypothetical protein
VCCGFGKKRITNGCVGVGWASLCVRSGCILLEYAKVVGEKVDNA